MDAEGTDATQGLPQEQWTRLSKTQKTLESRLENLKAKRQHVYAEMNDLLLICRLPNNILSRIFIIAYKHHILPYTAVRLSHVCRSWRAAAIATPALWSSMLPHNTSLAKMCLARAGDLPLRLYLPDTNFKQYWKDGIILSFVAHVASRLAEIDLTLHPADLNTLSVFMTFHEGWEHLESLSLSVPEDLCISHELMIDFRPTPPKLRKLSFNGIIPMVRASGVFSNVRILELSMLEDLLEDLPPMEDFLAALQNFVGLEELRIYMGAFRPLEKGTKEYPKHDMLVHLDHLRYGELIFMEPINHAYLLAHLAIPATTHIYQEMYGGHPNGLLRCYPRDQSNLHFLHSMSKIRLTNGAVHGYHQDHIDTADACLSVLFNEEFSDKSARLSILNLRSAFKLSPVIELQIEIALSELRLVTAADWNKALSYFTSLRTLRYKHSGPLEDLPEYITPLFEALTVSIPGQLPVPTLCTLELANMLQSSLDTLDDRIRRCDDSRGATPGVGQMLPFEVVVNGNVWAAV
ncbi:hypothetical protein EIP91_012393 [Steccherinum ochraceum]|uniref:F-box domain-containing protein n=1 Tax=Steccherinum ochraceum TaxID=92696 RepID=A0A4R0RGN0_9APHY|nr:hypothetical protein EIP91_012393 [Steccherinum ochraceum]